MNWDDLRLFLAVARAGGLAAAAVETGKSAPTLGRRMLALESATGEELFRRQPRGYELTDEGLRLYQRIAGFEAQILPLERGNRDAGKPLVKVSAGSWMTRALCLRIAAMPEQNPGFRLRFIAAEHELDILRRETVVGIRNRRPEQAGLACRKIGRVEFAGYARGPGIETWIRVVGKTPSAQWLAARSADRQWIEVTAPRNALDLAHAGAGRALLPTFIGDFEPGLTRVSEAIPELGHDQWLVVHPEERFVPEVRRAIDCVYDIARSLHD